MRVDGDAVVIGHVADGVEAVLVGRLARLEAVFGHQPEFVAIAARLAGQIEAAVGFHFREQRAHALAVAPHQVIDETLEV